MWEDKKLLKIVVGFLVLLFVVDTLSTYIAIEECNRKDPTKVQFIEKMTVSRYLIENDMWATWVFMKIVPALFFLYVAFNSRPIKDGYGIFFVGVTGMWCAFFVFVISWNIYHIAVGGCV